MLFNTPEFFLFLGAVLLLFYVLPFQARKPLLLAASYFFYMSWIPKFILLLVALTLIDYAAAVWIASTDSQRRRKAALIISLCANLGLLGLGVSEPLPSWGSLLRDLENYTAVLQNPWMLAPVILLVLVVSCLQMLLRTEDRLPC